MINEATISRTKMKKYKRSAGFIKLILVMGLFLSSSYLTYSSLGREPSASLFLNYAMGIFTLIFLSSFVVFFSLFILKLLDINQCYVLHEDSLEFPKYFFFIKPQIVKYSDIVNSELVIIKRGYLVEELIRLTLKNNTVFISEKALAEDKIEDLQKEIENKIRKESVKC